jgi:hypothetical protein
LRTATTDGTTASKTFCVAAPPAGTPIAVDEDFAQPAASDAASARRITWIERIKKRGREEGRPSMIAKIAES